jgi:hypothetical protein
MGFNIKQWGAISIAALFAMSIVGFIGVGNNNTTSISGASTSTLEYNGYKINKVGDYWEFSSSSGNILFIYPPTALESIAVPNTTQVQSILSGDKIYLAHDPKQSLDLSQLRIQSYAFFSHFNVQTFSACSQETGCPDIPIIDCSVDHAIIFIQDDENTIITPVDNCLEVHAKNLETMQRQLEKLFYIILNVVE